MHAGNNGCSYAGCDDYIEEDEFDNNGEYIALNYNDFLDHRNKSRLSPPLDESESENYDFDEQHCEGQGNYEKYFIPDSSGKSVAGGQHSCLKLKDNYCYLDRNAYDTRVMRNLTSTEDYELPRGSYSPRFIQAALERTKSSSFWGDDDEFHDFAGYDDQEIENISVSLDDQNYCSDYHSQQMQPSRQVPQASRHRGCGDSQSDSNEDTADLVKLGKVIYHIYEPNDAFSDVSDATVILEALEESFAFQKLSKEHLLKSVTSYPKRGSSFGKAIRKVKTTLDLSKKDRTIAALWVKKLRDMESDGPEANMRTEYLKLLLFVMQRNKLAGIFEKAPPDGPLQAFPPNYKATEMLSLVKPRKITALAYPPVFTSVGGDLCQFVAVQEIPNFGLHGYYAISIEPLPKWSHASTNSAKKAKLKPKHFADCFKDTCKLAEKAYHSKNKPDKPASSSLSTSQQPASQQQLPESADKNSQELIDPKNAEAGFGNKKKQPNDCERISRATPKFIPFPPIPYQSYRKEIAGFESRPTWGRSRYFERLIDESPHLPTDLDVSQADALLHGISDKTFKKAENHGPCAISETRRRVERMMDLPPCALDPGEAMPPPGSPYTCCPKREPVIDTHCVDMCLSEQDFYPCEERSSVSLRGGSDSGSCCNSQNRRSRSRTSSNSRINDMNSRQYYAAQFPRQQRNDQTTRYGSINDDTDGTLDVDTSIQNITTTSRYLDPEKSGNFKWLENMEHVTFSDPTEMSFTGSDSRARMRSFSSNTTMNGGCPDFDEESPINEELHPEELMPRAAQRMHSSKLHHSQRSSSPPGRSSSCYPNNRSYAHDSWEQQTGLSHINEDIEPSIAVVRRRYAKSREASNRRPEIHEKTYRWKEIIDETEPSRNESLCSKDVNRMSSFDPEYLDYIEAVRSDRDYCCEDEDEEIEKPRYSNRISGPAMDRDMLQYTKKLMRPPKPPPSSGRVIMPLSKQSQRKQRILEMEETDSPDVNVNEDE